MTELVTLCGRPVVGVSAPFGRTQTNEAPCTLRSGHDGSCAFAPDATAPVTAEEAGAPSIVREGERELRYDVSPNTSAHHLHEPMEFPALCAMCAVERDCCKCLWYGHGFHLTRIPTDYCEIHG